MSLGVFLLLQPLKKLKKDACKFFFVCLVEFAYATIWCWTFVCGECFYYIFNFISSDGSVQLIYLFLIQFWRAECLQKVVHFSQVVKFVSIYKCSQYSFTFFVFLQYPLRFLLFHLLFYLSSFSPLLGKPDQRFVNCVYPFKDPALGYIDFFLLFFEYLVY